MTAPVIQLLLGWIISMVPGPGWSAVVPVESPGDYRVVRCPVENVVVRSTTPDDASIVCLGARDAIRFLAGQGLDVSNDVMIDIVPRMPSFVRNTASGCYVPSERRVLVLAYERFREFKTWFRLPIDASLYRSLVAHEVAHAIAACNFQTVQPTLPATEYIAYVTMFATMNPDLRKTILSRFPGTGYDNEEQMNTTIYLADPMRFGVQAYRHYLKPDNGREFLHATLRGESLTREDGGR